MLGGKVTNTTLWWASIIGQAEEVFLHGVVIIFFADACYGSFQQEHLQISLMFLLGIWPPHSYASQQLITVIPLPSHCLLINSNSYSLTMAYQLAFSNHGQGYLHLAPSRRAVALLLEHTSCSFMSPVASLPTLCYEHIASLDEVTCIWIAIRFLPFFVRGELGKKSSDKTNLYNMSLFVLPFTMLHFCFHIFLENDLGHCLRKAEVQFRCHGNLKMVCYASVGFHYHVSKLSWWHPMCRTPIPSISL